jgi:hypothetical protein
MKDKLTKETKTMINPTNSMDNNETQTNVNKVNNMKAFNFNAQNLDSHATTKGVANKEAQPCFPRAISRAIVKLNQSIAHAEGRWQEGPALWPAMKSDCFTFHKSEEGYAEKDIVHVFFKVGLERVQDINIFNVTNAATGEVEEKRLDYFKLKTDENGKVGDKVIATLKEFKSYLESLERGDNPVIDAMCGRACAPKQKVDANNPAKKVYDSEADLWVEVKKANLKEVV